MKRYGWIAACILLLTLAAVASPAQEKFKLKPGAKGKLCLTCHVTFEDKLKSPFLHTPVKAGECSGCHNPHTASHGKLLDKDADRICAKCHQVLPAAAKSEHKTVREGKCTVCHDPHGSKNRNNLVKGGNELCSTCHAATVERAKKSKFKHRPVGEGCLNCHTPHASAATPALLKAGVPGLCVRCHRTDGQLFAKQHLSYPVAKEDCTSCHDPHGSDRAGILFNTVHKPVAGKMCNQCHEDPASGKPLTLKRQGIELCRGCHSTMVAGMLDRNHVHGPVLSKDGCLSCHAAHASAGPGLLKGTMTATCGGCHSDTIARQLRSAKPHAPVGAGDCAICHLPHASDATFLLGKSVIDTCAGCHDWKKHTTHPMGEKVQDRRNKNLSVQCLSCHSAHGTEYRTMIYYATVSELCTQCHQEYRR